MPSLKYTHKMVTDRHAAMYNMKHKHRGMALIFSHEIVVGEDPRTGTKVDSANLARVLEQLDFSTSVHEDLCYADILHVIRAAASQDHTDNDCVVVVIMSHGTKDMIKARDTAYKLDTIWAHFTTKKCPTLAGKPRLFFVQACQGDCSDAGVTMKKIETDAGPSVDYRIPLHPDFLIAYSSVPGYISWRNRSRGSWFIQSLCAVLEANGKRLDLLTLLTFVCQRVAIDFESSHTNPELAMKKQTSTFTSMLTRILIFSEKQNLSAEL
ncbi:hypothetical protein KR222_001570, partial [Zaprionus bogoriensis]